MQGWAGLCVHPSAAAPGGRSSPAQPVFDSFSKRQPLLSVCSVQGLHNSQEIIAETISAPLTRQGMFSQQTLVCWRWYPRGCNKGWLEFCSPGLRMNNLNPLKALAAFCRVLCLLKGDCPKLPFCFHGCSPAPLGCELLPPGAALGYTQLVSVSKISLELSVLPNYTCKSLSGDY